MITINSSDVKSINAALLSLQQGTTVYNNSTSTTTAAASSSTTTDTSKLVTMINANTKLIDSNSVRITSLESTIGEINTSISDLALQVSTNTGAISALQDSLTYWSGFLPYRFYESNRTVNLTNGYGETQTIDINSWLADYLPLTGGTLSGELTVNADLTINGNIYQNGSAYDTHAEQVYTKDNLIILRDGAVAAMASGEYAGFEALLYDGTNNGYLVFDNSGTAYVGDEGSLQPLATRDTAASMTDGNIVYWNAATSSLKTSSYAPGTTSGTLSLVTSNTYDAANIGTVSFSGASATKNIYQPNQALNTTSSPTFSTVTAALSGNATSATTASKVTNSLTIRQALSSSTSYNGSAAASVYSPGQLLETTSSPTFVKVTADLNGNATSSSTASKVANGLTIGKTVSSSTTYNGSEAASVYSPGQLLETTSSPTFNTVTAALSGNATTASTASKVANALTIGRTVSSSTTYNGSNIASVYSPGQLLEITSSPTFSTVTASLTGNATSASTASKVANALTIAPTNTYTAVASTSYDGSAAKTSTIYTPNQNVNTTASPTFNTVTAALSGNATSATTASKVTNALTIGKAISSSTSYNGSAAASVYSPGQLLETTSSPTFVTVTAALSGNATSATTATTASKVANVLSIRRTVSSSTSYNGSAAASVYSPGQLLETTSSPTFWSTYHSSSSVKSYDMTSSKTMAAADVVYDTIKFTGALTADATFTLYFNSSTLAGRKIYHILNECTTANTKQTITITTNNGTSVGLTVKKSDAYYVTDVFVDVSGNVIQMNSVSTQNVISNAYALTISSSALSTSTAYNGSSAVTIYSPGQLLETTSSPTFNALTVSTINGMIFGSKYTTNTIPYILSDGVMEIGKYLDFHADAANAYDYDVRFGVTSGASGGDGIISVQANNFVFSHYATFNGPLIVQATNAKNNYDEGIRINRGIAGYSDITFGCSVGSSTGIIDGAWWLGIGPLANYGRKLFISHNGSIDSTGASDTYFFSNSSSNTVGLHINPNAELIIPTTASSTTGAIWVA